MDILNIIMLIGGLAFFLYGMRVMSGGLEKMAGSRLEKLLRSATGNRFKGLLLGAGITVAIQSSSALTVMLVGLVNSGIMQVGQTIGPILGAHVGTTLTAWILSLSGITSDNVYIQLLKPENFSPLFAMLGILLIMMGKKNKQKDIGSVFVGFAVLMYGMVLMQQAMSPLAKSDAMVGLLEFMKNPILGLLGGTVFTGLIQSSAASVGILQSLSNADNIEITCAMAIPVIAGLNIGTCVTALISSIGVSKDARKVALVHILSNAVGAVVCLALFYLCDAVFHFEFMNQPVDAVTIALIHTIFNIATTILWLPFFKLLEGLANLLVRDKKNKEVFLDERLLLSPAFAITECEARMQEMAELSRDSIVAALDLLNGYDEEIAGKILESEEKVDHYEDKLGSYLVKLAGSDFSDEDTKRVSRMLHAIGDMERLSDHAVNILKAAEEMHQKELSFSEDAQKEMSTVTAALRDILNLTFESFLNNDVQIASHVEPLEQVIDSLTAEVKDRHVERLQRGACTINGGFVLSDLLNNFERVSDHCSNIAVNVIQLQHRTYATHTYLNSIKTGESEEFNEEFREYTEKYTLEAKPEA